MVSNDEHIAEVRQLGLDQALDVSGGNVLTTRCDDQFYTKSNKISNNSILLSLTCSSLVMQKHENVKAQRASSSPQTYPKFRPVLAQAHNTLARARAIGALVYRAIDPF